MQSNLLKLFDLVEFYSLQLLYKASRSLLPAKLQKLFALREAVYNLRGYLTFVVPWVHSNRKCMCVSVKGVRLWNGLKKDSKQCPTLYFFLKLCKEIILLQYSVEEGLQNF